MSRWWGVRHLRWLVLAWQFRHWWDTIGRHHWLSPNEADFRYLQDVWEGKV